MRTPDQRADDNERSDDEDQESHLRARLTLRKTNQRGDYSKDT